MPCTRPSPPRLADADLRLKLKRARYEDKLKRLQRRLARIQQAYLKTGTSAVIVLEGWDAAGKGGTIRRLAAPLDPRSFKVWPIGAPREYYLNRHYLARFVERLPPQGTISVFDRSWYGRVLVERVEGVTPEARWREAYDEINGFEALLARDGMRVVKLFLHLSPEEQLERFEERLRNPVKRWKLSYEDFRNRDRWGDYSDAIDEMFARTTTDAAPWHVIPTENKRYGRIAALTLIARALGHGIDLSPEPLAPEVLKAAHGAMDLEPDLVARLSGRTD